MLPVLALETRLGRLGAHDMGPQNEKSASGNRDCGNRDCFAKIARNDLSYQKRRIREFKDTKLHVEWITWSLLQRKDPMLVL